MYHGIRTAAFNISATFEKLNHLSFSIRSNLLFDPQYPHPLNNCICVSMYENWWVSNANDWLAKSYGTTVGFANTNQLAQINMRWTQRRTRHKATDWWRRENIEALLKHSLRRRAGEAPNANDWLSKSDAQPLDSPTPNQSAKVNSRWTQSRNRPFKASTCDTGSWKQN